MNDSAPIYARLVREAGQKAMHLGVDPYNSAQVQQLVLDSLFEVVDLKDEDYLAIYFGVQS
jgi:hypothetical protein